MSEIPNFEKSDGLIPAIIQDVNTLHVLMLGYMNEEAYKKTLEEHVVWFYSRSKQRLWKKGESSGHVLKLRSISLDCDNDTFLIKVDPTGPVCHTGSDTCWGETNQYSLFLQQLESVINERKNLHPESSYTARLFSKGINKVAQKLGEEAVELVIEAKDDDEGLFLNEAADLLYHFLVLLRFKEFNLSDVDKILKERHK